VFGRSKEEKKTPPAAPPSGGVPVARIETVIGPNAHFRGDIISEGGVRIDGIFEGSIETTSNLVVGESAKIIAQVKANNISISGAIKGDVEGNRIEILETGRVWGDLTVNSLLLNEGAYLRGQTTMQGDIEPPLIEAPKPASTPTVPEPRRAGTIVDVEPARPVEREEE
jgi:cytoskeletal protein CcmA (bactofilin family)